MSTITADRPGVYLETVIISPVPKSDDMPSYWSVSPQWAGVDRPVADSVGCTTLKMAERLRDAILAGVALGPAKVGTDINGKTYVNAPHNFLARRLNADLKKLGF